MVGASADGTDGARWDAAASSRAPRPSDRPSHPGLPGRGARPRPRRFPLTLTLLGLTAVLGVVAGWSVTLGQADITTGQVWTSAVHHLCSGLGSQCVADPLTPVQDAIVWQGRAPRVVAAAAVGAGLALAGAVMQALTRNPLADPYLLGVSSGASVGAVLVLVLGLGVLLPVAAFVGGLAALVITLGLATGRNGGLSPVRTVLAGVAVAQLGAAVLAFVIFWSATGDSYRDILSWLLGRLGGTTWAEAAVALGATVVVGGALLLQARTLDAFTFGDTAASSLGVDVRAARWGLLAAAALLTGALVSVAGAIGFVGLVLPHAVRFLTGPRHYRLLPVSALAGATFLVLADTASRSMFAPRELPVGIITAAVGAPVFAVLLRRRGSTT